MIKDDFDPAAVEFVPLTKEIIENPRNVSIRDVIPPTIIKRGWHWDEQLHVVVRDDG